MPLFMISKEYWEVVQMRSCKMRYDYHYLKDFSKIFDLSKEINKN
jgi:hypothetical protein